MTTINYCKVKTIACLYINDCHFSCTLEYTLLRPYFVCFSLNKTDKFSKQSINYDHDLFSIKIPIMFAFFKLSDKNIQL